MTDPDRPAVEDAVETARSRPADADAETIDHLLAGLDGADAPLCQTAAVALASVADARPDLLADAVDRVAARAAHEQATVRNMVASALAALAASDPDAAEPAAPELVARLDDDHDAVLADALAGLVHLARAHPSEVRPAVPALVSLATEPRDDRSIRLRAVAALYELAAEHPDEVAPSLPDLLDVLRSEPPRPAASDHDDPGDVSEPGNEVVHEYRDSVAQHDSTREGVVATVATLAATRPDEVAPLAEDLADLLDDENAVVRRGLLECLDHVARQRPAAVVDSVPAVATGLRDDDDTNRARAARVLALLSDSHPEVVAGEAAASVDAVRPLLDHERPEARTAAVSLLAYLAEERPDAVRPLSDAVLDRLEDPAAPVRGQAAWTLAYLGASDAAPALRERREADPDADVRRIADRALDRLDD